ncbi:ADP-ribosylglycohydrolase family protein [Litorihabitans aurantiacus]|uniref:ADP-ribosylglycohydrolase n=1 Tax=Litorihabitans aurantiacus TaxID=1930061 RepID=A0AA38CRW6_9MICO|nr:ADP-ribosylglycohydrolase family protein [Litorihabitans aurantiacus]GMA33188.1 hypothetical protein GCM10025875_31800 [Litorihabitans aurantiacus]
MPELDLAALDPDSLMMFHDEEGDGVALAVFLRDGQFCRARRTWHPLPRSSTILDGISLRCVHPDFVALYDQLQDHGQMPSVAQTQEFEIDVKPGAAPTQAPIVRRRPFGAAGPPEAAVRGMLLGLALGDGVAATGGAVPPHGVLRAGAASQLGLATADGLLRTEVSRAAIVAENPTIVAMREVVQSYRRWAVRRGEMPPHVSDETGWTAGLELLRERRGSSPTTVRALLRQEPLDSDGYHALLRSTPIAAWNREQGSLVRAMVGVTHSIPKVGQFAQLWTVLLRRSLAASSLEEAATVATNEVGARTRVAHHLGMVRERAGVAPCDHAVSEKFAMRRSALSALTGGAYVAFSYPDADTIEEALAFAARATHGNAVAAVAGALLGALHGVHALPPGPALRLELGWAADTLARDLAAVGRAGAMGDLQRFRPLEAARLRRAYTAIGDQG